MEQALRDASTIDLRMMWDVAAVRGEITGIIFKSEINKERVTQTWAIILILFFPLTSNLTAARKKFLLDLIQKLYTGKNDFSPKRPNRHTFYELLHVVHVGFKCTELDLRSSCWKKNTPELYSISSKANTITASFMRQNRVMVHTSTVQLAGGRETLSTISKI